MNSTVKSLGGLLLLLAVLALIIWADNHAPFGLDIERLFQLVNTFIKP